MIIYFLKHKKSIVGYHFDKSIYAYHKKKYNVKKNFNIYLLLCCDIKYDYNNISSYYPVSIVKSHIHKAILFDIDKIIICSSDNAYHTIKIIS